MKKFLLFILLAATLTPNAYCEAIKLKNGMIINGSIVGQTEYILNVQTSYGAITINQREVEKIMPDLHRVILKGGGEFIGTVLDLDTLVCDRCAARILADKNQNQPINPNATVRPISDTERNDYGTHGCSIPK